MEAALLVGKWIVKALGGYRACAFLLLAMAFLASSSFYKHEALRLKGERDKAVVAAALADARLKQAQAEVTVQVVTKYVDRIVKVQGVTRTIVQKVPVYVTPTADAACVVPVGFVRLHDAAAQGVVPDPAGEPDAPAPGVALSTVATTVADNYGAAHETAEQLKALQDWIRAQQALTK